MTNVPPRSLGAMATSTGAVERPSILVLLARRAAAALLPAPHLVPDVRYARLTRGDLARR